MTPRRARETATAPKAPRQEPHQAHEDSILGARRWELMFPGMPPGPNDLKKLKLRRRMGECRMWKLRAWALCFDQEMPTGLNRIRVSATFHRRSLNVADEDNDRARLKPLVDGLVLYELVPKDTRKWVEYGECREERGEPGVRLIIEEVEV